MVRGGDVLAVPARGEEELGTDTVDAVLVHVLLAGHGVAVTRALGGLVVVEAVEADGLLAKGELSLVLWAPGRGWRVGNDTGEVAQAAVTGEHGEALGEGLDVFAQEEVVGKHTTNLGNDFGHAALMHKVKRGCPVGRLVAGELA